MMSKLTKRAFLGTAAMAGATLALPAIPARADGVDLVLSSWLPPRHPIVVDAIKPWAKEIEQATEGRVRIRVLVKPLGSPPSHFDMARDGVADITYGLHSFTQDDRFKTPALASAASSAMMPARCRKPSGRSTPKSWGPIRNTPARISWDCSTTAPA
jgi:TRAP-type mannitol/chloroaromatic compound transport system substrate-binding protein